MPILKRLVLFLALLLTIAPATFGQEEPSASVEVEVDRSEITIGDRIHYKMNISYDPGVELQKPGWGKGLESFQILDFERGNPKMVEDHWETTDVYTLSTFTPEDYVIPPIQIPIKLPSGATQVLETQPITIKVASVLPDDDETLQLKDIREPVPVYSGISWTRVAWVAGCLLALLVAGFLIWRFRRHEDEVVAPAPPRPEHEVAFQKLRALREKIEGWGPNPDAADCKVYGFELSEILREYLERRLGIIALEMTTEQLDTHFRRAPLGGKSGETPHEEEVMEILRQTDLLKFAKATDTKEHLLAWIFATERVIDATKRFPDPVIRSPEEVQEAA
ncbi:MAG: hypothetical protein KC940_12450 [Candidatus Omnitrophica bacterium]|nr:hypothetical protein [Candidatus Omnitrophota bacterium]